MGFGMGPGKGPQHKKPENHSPAGHKPPHVEKPMKPQQPNSPSKSPYHDLPWANPGQKKKQ